jgi:hypothetical protein
MDRLNHYRQIIQQLLREYSQIRPVNGEIEVTTAFDLAGDHYQIVHTGWEGDRRVYDCPIHVGTAFLRLVRDGGGAPPRRCTSQTVLHADGICCIKGDKVWIQQDMTDLDVATELVQRGIPKGEIVLAFQSPDLRQYTEFAAG